MPDMEKVIKGLEYCEEYFNCCDKCPYWDGGTHCAADLAHDALELLKEQEAVEPNVIRINDFGHPVYACGKCGLLITESMIYCHECGKRINWEGR